jgi:hypothetical protein
MTYQPEIIYIEEGAGDYDLTRRVLETFPDVPVRHQPDLPEVMDELQQSSVVITWSISSKTAFMTARTVSSKTSCRIIRS